MNARVLIAAFVGAIISFLLGWIIYGYLTPEFYNTHMLHYSGLEKSYPNLLGIFLSCFAYTLLLAVVFGNMANITTLKDGLLAGVTISLLMSLSFNLNLWSMLNLYGKSIVLVDTLINAATGGLIGAVMALIIGYKKTE